MRKSVTYHVTLFYNDVRALADRIKSALFKSPPKWKWWNKVHTSQSGGGEIYLGAIPISKQLFGLPLRNDLNTLTQTCGVKAILSAVEEFEINASGLVIRPIKKRTVEKGRHLAMPYRHSRLPIDRIGKDRPRGGVFAPPSQRRPFCLRALQSRKG